MDSIEVKITTQAFYNENNYNRAQKFKSYHTKLNLSLMKKI